jgi:hypothetical protein
MPGLLRADAKCPLCGDDLIAIADTSNSERIVRLYYHAKGSPVVGRKRRCRFVFGPSEFGRAKTERRRLEVPLMQQNPWY